MNIKNVLKRLKIDQPGGYENDFYTINLTDSDEYAKMYTQLSDLAINTEEPSIGKNTNNTTTKITNYFEIDEENVTYNIFLIADFDTDTYRIRIGRAGK